MFPLTETLYDHLPWLLRSMRRLLPEKWHPPSPIPAGALPDEIRRRFPHAERDAATFRLQSRWLQEKALRVDGSSLPSFLEKTLVVDMERLHAWTRGARGVIFACPHYGPFLGAALLFASEGQAERPANIFYDAPADVPSNERFDVLFERFSSLRVLHNNANDLIAAGRALRNRQCVSIMFDVVQRPIDCMYLPFFDRLYPAMGGAAFLSLMAKASIIPTYASPMPDRRIRIEFGEELRPEAFAGKDKEQALFEMTGALFKDLERQLAMAPWHWIYWGNVKHAPPIPPMSGMDSAGLLAELRRRIDASSGLAKLAPGLYRLLDAGEIR